MWCEWDTFLLRFFDRVPHVQKRQHFRFDNESPGHVFIRESVDQPEVDVPLLRKKTTVADVLNADLPIVLPSGGLSVERMKYLYKDIRPHASPDCQDELCPSPPVDVEADLSSHADV